MTDTTAPPYVLSGATVLTPGDSVLLTTDRDMPDDEAQATIMALHDKFTGVDFVLITGFKVFKMTDGQVTDAVRAYPANEVYCDCGSKDGGHTATCPVLQTMPGPLRMRDDRFYTVLDDQSQEGIDDDQ